MKTKYFFLAALTGLALAGCSSDDFIADAPPVDANEGMTPIMFNSLGRGMTRADYVGAAAATKLGNKFVVFGYKGSETGDPGKATNGVNGGTVFDNYLVEYAENTAHTTASNTDNWEYVGKGVIKHAKDHGITQQTIKYWDYSQSQYDFFAWSTGSKTAIYEKVNNAIPSGNVLVSEIKATKATTAPATGLVEAYTFTGTANDLKDCYISDLVTVYKGTAPGTGTKYGVVENGYQQPVTLKFRQLGTKVRIGIYETVPGYSVKDVKFYSAAATALAGDATDANAKIFTTAANIFKEGVYTVYFPTVDNPNDVDNNQAHIDFAPKDGAQETTVDWGGLNYTIRESGESNTGYAYLGRTSNTASFAGDADANYYVVYLPNQTGTNLNLRVNYTLEAIDGGGETIEVKGATAQVPAIYAQWKPGYAYTYLFKISDKTNGHTGVYDPTKPDDTTVNSDPAGLYPITFDAIVVNAEDADHTQETITLVSTPSITTYQNGSNVVNNNEYTVLTAKPDKGITGEIYVTVNDGAIAYEAVDVSEMTSVDGLYTEDGGNYVAATGTPVTGKTYYRMKPILENADLADLTGSAKLYTIPAGKTEAEVIDALQVQDDDAEDGTIKGRSGLVLTKVTEITTDAALEAGQWKLTNEVTYGADGNKIDLTDGNTKKAAKFLPEGNKTYAFVYIKTAPDTDNDEELYEVKTFAVDAVVNGYYRYAYKGATCTDNKGTESTSDDIYDAQKGVKYFSKTGDVYKMETAFIGQNVSNAYKKVNGEYVIASGYAVTGTEYWYTTDNGISYTQAHNEAYADFATDVTDEKLYTFDGTNYTKVTGITAPADNTAYYYKVDDDTYTWCIILPQQTKDWYELDIEADKAACGDTEKAIDGQTYFDKYIVNDGVYYSKVIKVQ